MTPISPDQYETFCFTCGACVGKSWVGLHWDDMPEEYAGNRSFLEAAKWAEAKLKEKNGG